MRIETIADIDSFNEQIVERYPMGAVAAETDDGRPMIVSQSEYGELCAWADEDSGWRRAVNVLPFTVLSSIHIPVSS